MSAEEDKIWYNLTILWNGKWFMFPPVFENLDDAKETATQLGNNSEAISAIRIGAFPAPDEGSASFEKTSLVDKAVSTMTPMLAEASEDVQIMEIGDGMTNINPILSKEEKATIAKILDTAVGRANKKREEQGISAFLPPGTKLS